MGPLEEADILGILGPRPPAQCEFKRRLKHPADWGGGLLPHPKMRPPHPNHLKHGVFHKIKGNHHLQGNVQVYNASGSLFTGKGPPPPDALKGSGQRSKGASLGVLTRVGGFLDVSQKHGNIAEFCGCAMLCVSCFFFFFLFLLFFFWGGGMGLRVEETQR